MRYAYFPGCTLKTKGKALDEWGRRSLEALGSELCELPEWQCCGAVYPNARDEIATRLSSVRALMAARDADETLVTLCSACHHVIKRVNGDLKNDEYIRTRVNAYLKPDVPYAGEACVKHYLEVLRDDIGFENVKKKVTASLDGRRVGAYYGCLLLRPSAELRMDDPEDPSIMEDLLSAIGATPVKYALRNECCGAYVTLEDKGFAKKRARAIIDNALACGVEELVTACPLCLYNLKENGEGRIRVTYFTELLAEALGVKEGEHV